MLITSAITRNVVQITFLCESMQHSFLVLGFALRLRKEHDSWQESILGRSNRTYTAAGLYCGTAYKFSIFAINDVGRSESSNIVEATTNGSGMLFY